MLFVPPRFWPVGHMLCNESLSSAQVPGLRYSSPPGSRCGMTMTRISLAPLRPTTAVMFRRDVTASAFCRRVISCLLAENAGNLLPSVTRMMYTDKLCYTNWFQPADCILSIAATLYSHDPEYSRHQGTWYSNRDTATSQQHATKSARIQN